MSKRDPVLVIGAGLVGPVLAMMLARRGHAVTVKERRSDPRVHGADQGRSVNLVLSRRGWAALEELGIEADVRSICRPLEGRTVHAPNGSSLVQPYSRSGRLIWCVERPRLHALLLDHLERQPGVALVFEQRCRDIDFAARRVGFSKTLDSAIEWSDATRVLAADGCFSGARQSLLYERFDYSQSYLDLSYKEFRLPSVAAGGPDLSTKTFHVWPRGRVMVGAFPNADDSFTCSLFLPHEGVFGVSEIEDPERLAELVQYALPGLTPWWESIVVQLLANPVCPLVTIRARPWHVQDFFGLIGDASHAIVPFFGQGMNCGFEDVRCLVRCLDETEDDWQDALSRYESERRPNADAIAAMSLEHHERLLADPPDPEELEFVSVVEGAFYDAYPDRFRPLYEAVAFTETPYVEAQQTEATLRAAVQEVLATPGARAHWAQLGPALMTLALERVGEAGS